MTESFSMNPEFVSLFKKWFAVMEAIDHMEKTGEMRQGRGGNYDFVEAAEVVKRVHKELIAHRLAFFPEIVDAQYAEGTTKSGGVSYHWILQLNISIVDIDSGAVWTRAWRGESLDYQDKGLGKALTLCLKYFWLQALLVGTGEPDPDGMVPQEPSTQALVASIKRNWTGVARELGIIPDSDELTAEDGATLKGILGDTYAQLSQVQEAKALRKVLVTGLGKLFSSSLS